MMQVLAYKHVQKVIGCKQLSRGGQKIVGSIDTP